MVLDSEDQRKHLLSIICNVPVQGNLAQMNVAIKQMNDLVKVIESAEVITKVGEE